MADDIDMRGIVQALPKLRGAKTISELLRNQRTATDRLVVAALRVGEPVELRYTNATIDDAYALREAIWQTPILRQTPTR